jgi:hypothetical protein
VEAWQEWGFREFENMKIQGTMEETFLSANELQQRALVLTSTPLLLTHNNAFKQEDGSLWSPVAALETEKPDTTIMTHTAPISKAPVTAKLVLAIKHHDLCGLDPKSCVKMTPEGCLAPSAALRPFWQVAIEKVLAKHEVADSLKPLEQIKLKIVKSGFAPSHVCAEWKRWVLGESAFEQDEGATHAVNVSTKSFRVLKEGGAVRDNEVAVQADLLPPMTAALGAERIPGIVWKTNQGSFLVETPAIGEGNRPILPFDQQAVGDKCARNMYVMPNEAVCSARVQMQLFDRAPEAVGWVPTKPDGFWMVVSPSTGSYAPLPSLGVQLVNIKKPKREREYKTERDDVGGRLVTGEDRDLYVVSNQDVTRFEHDLSNDDLWEQLRKLCVSCTPETFLGFVCV